MTQRERSIGWREVLVVAAVAVMGVLGAQVISTLFPAIGDVFRQTPVIVIGLVAATALVLWRIAAGKPSAPSGPPEPAPSEGSQSPHAPEP